MTGAATLAHCAGMAPTEYPEMPVNFIVPWPLGDLEDGLTGTTAGDFRKEYGIAAAVVNKPDDGAGRTAACAVFGLFAASYTGGTQNGAIYDR